LSRDEGLNHALLAERIVQDFAPRTVLDLGCGRGRLVSALRALNVDAEGFELSEKTIARAPKGVRPHLRAGSLRESIGRRYDLITCLGGVDRMAGDDTVRAIENICEHADDVLFSSVHGPSGEASGEAPAWSTLFARQGMIRDFDTDLAAHLPGWSVRFRRSHEPQQRVVAGYERLLWGLVAETSALRDAAKDNRLHMVRIEEELSLIKSSRAWRIRTRAGRLTGLLRSRWRP
jgi:2-polyprenyl-3-methyl-5-hydroxy-6-metoxy-1,4-benzoquinol methylase